MPRRPRGGSRLQEGFRSARHDQPVAQCRLARKRSPDLGFPSGGQSNERRDLVAGIRPRFHQSLGEQPVHERLKALA
jgi:hypothetical protein